MRTKSHRLFAATAMLAVCASCLLSWVLQRSKPQAANSSDKSVLKSGVIMELGPGMGPNLMTPASTSDDDSADLFFHELVDMVNAEFKDKWIVEGQASITRRYMSALVAGEGCKSYVDHGDGKWILIDDDTSTPIKRDDGGDPFADGGSNSNPFE